MTKRKPATKASAWSNLCWGGGCVGTIVLLLWWRGPIVSGMWASFGLAVSVGWMVCGAVYAFTQGVLDLIELRRKAWHEQMRDGAPLICVPPVGWDLTQAERAEWTAWPRNQDGAS